MREYTVAFQGSEGVAAQTIIEEKPQSPPPPKHPHLPPHRVRIHPIHEAREFLDEHNKVRKELGEPLLKWDRKLAHYARRFADKRAVNCDMIHSLGPYGENIYWGADYSRHTAAIAVHAWAGETINYNPMKNTCDPLKACGHYKQIVWKPSTKLGCARVKCNNGGVYIICSYDPPGNYVGESPFDTPQTSQTPSTPTSAQTKTPTPTSAQTKNPLTPTSAQTKTPSTPTSANTKTPSTPTSAQTKTPSTPTSAQKKTPTPTSANTKTPSTPTSAQTKTPTPTSANTKTPSTPTSAQRKTPSTPTSTQRKTPTPTLAHTKTPSTPTSAQTKTPTPIQTPTTHGGAKTKPISHSTSS